MAYGIIQFVEAGERKVTLVRTENGHPTGPDGVMDPLNEFLDHHAPLIESEGSPGAEKIAMLYFVREQEAGHALRILGAEGEWGIAPGEVEALGGRGHYYEVDVGRPGERFTPQVLASGIERPERS